MWRPGMPSHATHANLVMLSRPSSARQGGRDRAGVSRCRKHLGNDGNRYPRLLKDLAPENAEPNPDTGRDGGCDRLHPKPARSSLRRRGLLRQEDRA